MGGSVTLSDLKKHLGPGLGLRKSKYLIELPVKGADSKNILCQATSLPERTMSTTSVFFNGRKYNMRGETEYGGTFEVSFVDDSKMHLRQEFDAWMNLVDNSNFSKGAGQSGSSTFLKKHSPLGSPAFEASTVNVWQMGNDGVTPVYGYAMQNCFVSSVGTVTLDDTTENQMSEFSVVFTFSELVPLIGKEGEKKDPGTGSSKSSFPASVPVQVQSQNTTNINNLLSTFNLF